MFSYCNLKAVAHRLQSTRKLEMNEYNFVLPFGNLWHLRDNANKFTFHFIFNPCFFGDLSMENTKFSDEKHWF